MLRFFHSGQVFETGDFVTCTIGGRHNCVIDNARIYVLSETQAFICQNIVNGASPPDLLGYMFGYLFNNGEPSEVTNLKHKPKEFYASEMPTDYNTNLIGDDGGFVRIRTDI